MFTPTHYSWFYHYFIYLKFNCWKLIIWEEICGMMLGAARRKIGFALADGLRDGGRISLLLTLSATPWHLFYNNEEQRKSSSVGVVFVGRQLCSWRLESVVVG
jgi:hypothetical protein